MCWFYQIVSNYTPGRSARSAYPSQHTIILFFTRGRNTSHVGSVCARRREFFELVRDSDDGGRGVGESCCSVASTFVDIDSS